MTGKSCNLLELGVAAREIGSGTILVATSDKERYRRVSK